LTSLSVAWGWGWRNPLASINDEASYLLQARIFASGRWTAPARAFPQFFEQMHQFVTPVTASKYPPGHALLLAPGVWLGVPELFPILLGGLAGALLFALARRLSTLPAALVCWILWVTSSGVRLYGTTYLSEVTTAFLWLCGWWALLRWRETGSRPFLLLLALCLSWGILTRPLTMAVFGLFAAGALAGRGTRRPRSADLGLAALLVASILLLIPIWSWKTTGNWRTTPYALYSRLYFPYERPGFGLDPAAPLRRFPPEMTSLDNYFRRVHREHTLSRLPAIAVDRLRAIAGDMWGGRWILLFFFGVGLFSAKRGSLWALATCGGAFLAYLLYAHAPAWSVYYYESLPVLAFFTALGLNRAMAFAADRVGARSGAVGRGALLTAAAGGAILLGCWSGVVRTRAGRRALLAEAQALSRRFSRQGSPGALVFVPCALDHYPVCLLINGEPDLEHARVWFVHDRGPENDVLQRAVPERKAFRYLLSGAIQPLPEPVR
jgi:hypothetical protein